ncbi:MAG TPA: molybdopterin cofactor-binding domain-containing protein [Acetobacteraceae bacterium]|nr:molybdopterin cofactor-binding domain-containing protein [Acetobacteraceae bacterium]
MMRSPDAPLAFTLNGAPCALHTDPARRLSDLLRDDLGLNGTKIGCNAGDCGACTVLLDGRQVCACMIPAAQVAGRAVVTVEGLAQKGALNALQQAFLAHGAAQCGICTPGMLMAATDLLARCPSPTEAQVCDGLAGVLCRCTGYRKIIDAVLDAAHPSRTPPPLPGHAVGARMAKVDGAARLTGTERFGADALPDEPFLSLRAVRSPHAHARFTLGDFAPVFAAHPGLVRVLTVRDIPGRNLYGIYPTGKDQPVLAERHVRHRGEPVCALVGPAETLAAIEDSSLPIVWEVLPPIGFGDAEAPDAPQMHPHAPGNILCRGRVATGDPDAALAQAAIRAEIAVETGFVEHAYIEPEAGYARRVGDRIEVVASTQTPYMDRDELALILGLRPDQVRVIPTAVGGGFGGKLDLSVQPLVCTAAWLLNRPVRMVYSRAESMEATTKRHPARIRASAAAGADGLLTAFRFHGDFNTGAYASWGPTVANRVPVHAMGPYAVPHVRCTSAAIHTTDPPSGAFRGFGVPQAAIAHEALMDMLAGRLGLDPLEFRLRNALRPGSRTATGQVLGAGAALPACLEALRPRWRQWRAESGAFNRAASGKLCRGTGIACMWYGIGNTSLPNPSEMVVGIDASGRATLFSGAVDIGQGSNTIMVQIAADALGIAASDIALVTGDTDRTRDAGKTSASRQTFVSGNAARAAAEALRGAILRHANAGPAARIALHPGRIVVSENGIDSAIDLARLPAGADGLVLRGEGRFDPPTTALDADGQGIPYAAFAFAAQIAEVEVDIALGTVRACRIAAAHDVGRAINPTQVEGQIHGGIAQGLGLALMEEFIPGRTANLHDYLIPTIGDIPPIETILIEEPDPLGPFGAKGVGEPALVATAPAILNAIHHATGVRITRVPATPDRMLAALKAGR